MVQKQIVIGSDHGAWEMKESIKEILNARGFNVLDYSLPTMDSVDYPQIGKRVAQAVSKGDAQQGILLCGTGIGMSMLANKFPNVRAALCHDEFTAAMSREHNDANILVLGGRVLSKEDAQKIVRRWLDSSFPGDDRHKRRLAQIADIEKENFKAL